MDRQRHFVWLTLVALTGLSVPGLLVPVVGGASPTAVGSLKVTLLSTMLTDTRGLGEWGFAALVEADGFQLLYDTGYRPQTVLDNAAELGVDLAPVADVVLSHNHGDHTGGLLTLRRALRDRNGLALSRAHAGRGLFARRQFGPGLAKMGFHFPPMGEVRAEYEALGGTVFEYDEPVEIEAGVWLTGPVPRVHPEKNWSPGVQVESEGAWRDDTVAEDSALVINTTKGLVILSGCGHAGIVNILDYARTFLPDRPIHAVIGGLHLFAATDETLDWTAEKMKRSGVAHLLGAHCTGLHATYRLRERLGLARERAAVGAVGARFSLDQGIEALRLAR